MNKIRYTIVFLLIALFPANLLADTQFISSRNGLSNSSINCIYKDSEDLVWFGTWDGLNRYDGSDFDIYRSSLDEHSVSSSIIRQVLEDSSNRLWIATDRGIDRYDRASDTFTRYFSDVILDGVTVENSFHIAKGPQGELVAAISGKGLYLYDSAEDRFALINSYSSDYINGLFFDCNSNILLKSGNKLQVFTKSVDGSFFSSDVLPEIKIDFVAIGSDPSFIWLKEVSGNTLQEVDINKRAVRRTLRLPLKVKKVNSVDDRGETLLVGTDNGLYEYADTKCSPLLEDVPVLSVLRDEENIIWAGTDMLGAALISNFDTPFKALSGNKISSFANSAVRTFYEEMPGRLWVGTKGNGIVRIDLPYKDIAQIYTTESGLNDNNVYSLSEGDEVIWAGTDGKGVMYIDKSSGKLHTLQTPGEDVIASIYSILQTERNVIWVGTSGHGLFRIEFSREKHPYKAVSLQQFTKENGSLRSNIVYSIAMDRNKNIWAGTRGGGLEKFTIDGLHKETPLLEGEYKRAINDIICLAVDSDERLLIGTSLGLFYKDDQDNIERIESQHLDDTSIHGIIEDNEKNLWISTNNGLIRIDPHQKPLIETRFSQEDGLQGNEFSDGSFYKSPLTENLFFGGNYGFSYFKPEDTKRTTPFPKLRLNGVYFSHTRSASALRENNGVKEIVIGPDENSFTLKFAILDFLASDRCELAYRIAEAGKDWIYIGTSKNIAFPNLRHGNYTLEVRHTNSDKVWCDDIYRIRIRVLPHWYQKWYTNVLFLLLGLLTAALVIWSIVSRRKEHAQIQEKEDEKNKLIDIHEAKLRFFTNIAHEFSNSLTLIYGPCRELQKMSTMPEGSQKYLKYIESNSSRMLNLIQQIISFRKAETGHLSLNPVKIKIQETILSTEDYFRGNLEKNSIRIQNDFSGDERIWGTDKDCFEKITFNLLSNATKYTPSGGTIEVKCEADEKENKLKIRITNYGIGIPEEKQEAIFDRFEVLDRFENNIRKGKISNGIGLSMCKNLVELMNGRIWIDSDGKSYTSFCFELPELEAAEENLEPLTTERQSLDEVSEGAEDIPAETSPDKKPSSEIRILIVDDDKEIRSFIKNLLSKDYFTLEATDGREALTIIEKSLPDLVISDVIMPGMDGFQLLRAIRENNVYRHIPVILLTSETSDGNKKMALDKGADAFVGKPFDPDILTSQIVNLLGRDKAIIEYSNSSLSAMDRFLGEEISKEDKALLSAVTEVIDKNMDNDELCMEFIAEKVSVSKMQLYRKFKTCLNTTPVEYIKTLRIEKAEKLLRTTSMTVQQIMYACGFNSKTYFYKEFSKANGLTPKQYRESSTSAVKD